MHRVSFGVALLGLSAASQSAEWVLEPGSQVTFEYSYGTDPYEGRFTNVQANFDIDPMRPTSCKFDVTINIEDIDVDSPEVLDYLLDYELFDVDTWPTATFSAESCRLRGVNTFESAGTL
ncbi:MAG: YceI family protein, partial [Pseudohongiellaceae bacterium]